MSEDVERLLEDRVLRALERLRSLEADTARLEEARESAARTLREAIADLKADDGEGA